MLLRNQSIEANLPTHEFLIQKEHPEPETERKKTVILPKAKSILELPRNGNERKGLMETIPAS